MERLKGYTRPLLPLLIGLGLVAVMLFVAAPRVTAWLPWSAAPAPAPVQPAAGPVPPGAPRAEAEPPAPPVAPRPEAGPRQDAAPRPPEPREAPRPPHPAPWGGWLWGWLLGTPHQWISIALIVGGLWLLGRQGARRPAQSITATPSSEPTHPETYQPPQEA